MSDVSDLQQVVLERLVDEQRRLEPAVLFVPRASAVRDRAVLPTGRQETRGTVRQQRVLDEEVALSGGGPAEGAEESGELLSRLTPGSQHRMHPRVGVQRAEHQLAGVDVGALAEPAPPLADRRQPAAEGRGQDAMEVPDGHVVEQAALSVEDRHLARPRAVAGGAEPRHLLGRTDRVPLAEQREEVVRVVGEGR